ncbi:hypothetical protein QL285_012737 [Trifolium repens]|nr:hypothetical protein QL285_012737 [Trifolium repens]
MSLIFFYAFYNFQLCRTKANHIAKLFWASDVSVKNDIRNQLRLIAYPETTNLQAPVEDAKSKGAKKKKRVRGTTREKSLDWNMQQTLDIVQCDAQLTYRKMEGTRLRMPSFSKSLDKSIIKHAEICFH